MRAYIALFILLIAAPAGAAPIRCGDDGEGGACVWGRVEAFDGQSVQIRGLTLQVAGIAVPGRRDLCLAKTDKEPFDCGRLARKRMGEAAAKGIACDILDAQADKLIARCRVAEGDLGRVLVSAGTARAAKDGPYESDQAAAMSAKRGLWAGDLILPRDWETLRRKSE